MAYLCGRPLPESDRCVLGRETAIQRMEWGADGWLRCAEPARVGPSAGKVDALDRFDGPDLPPAFQWLRTPRAERLFSLIERPGYLRLFGRETIGSHFEQALVARRQTAFAYDARTLVEFAPEHFQQAAGLICYYNSTKYHFLHITAGDDGERQLQVLSVLPIGEGRSLFSSAMPLPDGPAELRAQVDHEALRFAFRPAGEGDWTWLPETFDASILSDEAALPGLPNFTGTFVGMACQDMSGAGLVADFAYFHYAE